MIKGTLLNFKKGCFIEINFLAIKSHEEFKMMPAAHLYLSVTYHQNEIWVFGEKHDKKDTSIARVPKLPFFRKIALFNAFKCPFGA